MNRSDFCDVLVQLREAAGCGKNEMCRRANFKFIQLQYIESASRNCKMDFVFRYLKGIDTTMFIVDPRESRSVKVSGSEILVEFAINLRREKQYTCAEFAELLGFYGTTVCNIENRRQMFTMDYLLSICTYFKYSLIFKQEQGKNEVVLSNAEQSFNNKINMYNLTNEDKEKIVAGIQAIDANIKGVDVKNNNIAKIEVRGVVDSNEEAVLLKFAFDADEPGNGEAEEAAALYYPKGEGIVFTTNDWQGGILESLKEVQNYDWLTATPCNTVVMLGGLPRCI